MGTDCKDCNIESFMCNTCGVTMGLNREFTAKLRESHKSFVCPNGHSLAWNAPSAKEKEEEKLREEVKELKTKIETLQRTYGEERQDQTLGKRIGDLASFFRREESKLINEQAN